MLVEFDKRLFNPVYWHIKDAHENHDIRYIYLYGGSSASKTYSIAQYQSIAAIEQKRNLLTLRKEGATIKTTVYESFKDVQRKINKDIEFFDFFDFRIKARNDSQFVFKGLDDPEKVKGLESFDDVYLNELSKFNENDLDEVKRRLRGRPNQTIWADWNPVDETHWIKTAIIDKDEWIELPLELPGKPESKLDSLSQKWINKAGNAILIKVTYRDNYWVVGSPDGKYGFIDKHTIDNFEDMRTKKPNQYQIYGLGNWGSFRTGGEFWKSFNIDKHVKKVDYLPGLDIHVSVDINRLPYITQTLWQYLDREIRQFDELLAASPDNTAVKSAQKLVNYLERINFKGVIHLYGDASGNNKTAIDNDSFFGIYIRELKKNGLIINDRILKVNPSVSLSGAFINDIYEGLTPFRILIGDNCTKSKVDYNTVKEDKDGGMLKEKIKEGEVTYEKGGHISDAKRYFIIKLLYKEYKEFTARRRH